MTSQISVSTVVALRKESVDRNFCVKLLLQLMMVSLSARRAWIEISNFTQKKHPLKVALRKESVDRNRDDVSD